ncbi:MAG: universal stress protein [Verrucomicrobiota bacterium]|jgi:nucleotide-binding universal stress UspA family protein
MKTEYPCPGNRRNEPAKQLKNLLVPVDIADDAKLALSYALTFAHQFDGEITLLAVIPNNHISFEYGVSEAIALREQQREQSQRNLSKLAGETLGGIGHKIIVRMGKPFEEIIRFANETGVDLIIISSHGYPGVTRVDFTSTAENVVRYATCPVLVVPFV